MFAISQGWKNITKSQNNTINSEGDSFFIDTGNQVSGDVILNFFTDDNNTVTMSWSLENQTLNFTNCTNSTYALLIPGDKEIWLQSDKTWHINITRNSIRISCNFVEVVVVECDEDNSTSCCPSLLKNYSMVSIDDNDNASKRISFDTGMHVLCSVQCNKNYGRRLHSVQCAYIPLFKDVYCYSLVLLNTT